MKFKMFLNPIIFEAKNLDEAYEIASEVLVNEQPTLDTIEYLVQNETPKTENKTEK